MVRFFICLGVPVLHVGSTTLSDALNKQIKASDSNRTFTGGPGVIVRTPDDLVGTGVVIPATFWHNDINPPSQMYPKGNPWCPNQGSDGFETLDWFSCDAHDESANTGPWDYATVGIVVGSKMGNILPDWENVQNDDWNYGVFYATDSNSADKRCLWAPEYQGWDCPGYWIDADGSTYQLDEKKGAGYFPFGNPDAGGGGGGAGCHFDDSGTIDQVDAYSNGLNLVSDESCRCEKKFSGRWHEWVDNWIENKQEKGGYEWRNWLGNSGNLAPSWAIDIAACWMDNFRDMIDLQNALYNKRFLWSNQLVPQSQWDVNNAKSEDNRRYWGWNEIPVDRVKIDETLENWDAIIMKLPANICGNGGQDDSPTCLDTDAQNVLQEDLHDYVSVGHLTLGLANFGKSPGSSVLFVREMQLAGQDKWHREFFCENWSVTGGKYKIVSSSTCYIDSGELSL